MDENNFDPQNIISTLMRPGINSFNRMQEFLRLSNSLSDQEYWYGLQFAYTCSDDLYHLRHEIQRAFYSKRPGRNHLMNSDELEFLNALPEVIDVYRGMTGHEYRTGEFGISWTLKREVAEFFAYKYVRNVSTHNLSKMVARSTIPRQHVIAYLFDRKEFEIILETSGLGSVVQDTTCRDI